MKKLFHLFLLGALAGGLTVGIQVMEGGEELSAGKRKRVPTSRKVAQNYMKDLMQSPASILETLKALNKHLQEKDTEDPTEKVPKNPAYELAMLEVLADIVTQDKSELERAEFIRTYFNSVRKLQSHWADFEKKVESEIQGWLQGNKKSLDLWNQERKHRIEEYNKRVFGSWSGLSD